MNAPTMATRAVQAAPGCPSWCDPDEHTCWSDGDVHASAHYTLPVDEGGPVDLQLMRVPDEGSRVILLPPTDLDGWLLTVTEAAAVAEQLQALVAAAQGGAS